MKRFSSAASLALAAVAVRRSRASRLCLEPLEDRCLLSFKPVVNYSAGPGPQAVVAADFNNDAHPDLAVADIGSNTVSVLLGNTDGTFKPAQTSATGNGPSSLAVGDFNTDCKKDLATANSNSGDVSVLLGNGNGTFQDPSSIVIGNNTQSVAVGDFNADGKLDLGVLCTAYSPGGSGPYGWYGGGRYVAAVVLLGTGTGTFSAPISSYLGDGGYHTSAAVADFNGDLKLDVALTSDVGFIKLRLGIGAGEFYSPVYYSTGASPTSLSASDLNLDGKADLVATNAWNDSAIVLLVNGLGSSGSAQSYTAGSRPRTVATADFNGDGKIDLITPNDDTRTVSVLLGTGTGAFKPPVTAAVGLSPWGVAVGDFNGDGLMDAAATNFESDNVSVLLNDGAWLAPSAPALTISDVTGTEGYTGTVGAKFTVSLSAASSQTVSVRYATADGSASAAGGDYQSKAGTLTFAPGVTSQTVTVLVNGDRLRESNETFLLVLTDATNAFLADMKGVGSIVDDEPHVSIDYGPVYVTEGDSGTTGAVFTVHLTSAHDAPVSVNFSTAEGDTEWWYDGWYLSGPPPAATSGSDFQAASGTLTFAPGQTVKTIAISVNGDRLGEAYEYFSVNLSGSPSATIDGPHAVGVIVDDEPYVAIGSASRGTRARHP
jgi:hypothetical protein